MLEGCVHAYFLVEYLALRLGSFGRQCDNLACGNLMVLGMDGLKYSYSVL